MSITLDKGEVLSLLQKNNDELGALLADRRTTKEAIIAKLERMLELTKILPDPSTNEPPIGF